MDSLTQIVLGAAVGELVLGRKVGNKAILWGAIAGTIPDLDVISRAFLDDLRANELHRGITHSILFSLVMAPLFGQWVQRHQRSFLSVFTALVALVFFLGASTVMLKVIIMAVAVSIIALIFWRVRDSNTATVREWSWLFWWCLVTHPLLDCHTTWGTQLFWPLPVKVAYNNIFVVDPVYTVPLLICVAAAMFLKRNDQRRRWINILGLVISSCYMVTTLMFKSMAHLAISNSLQRQGLSYECISTRPTPFNSILWTTNVETEDAFHLGYYSLLDAKKDVDLVRIPKNRELLGKWADSEKIRRLARLSEDNYVIQLQHDTLLFCDLRFGQMGDPSPEKAFVYSYRLIPEGDDLRVVANPPPAISRARFKELMRGLWIRAMGE